MLEGAGRPVAPPPDGRLDQGVTAPTACGQRLAAQRHQKPT